MHLARRVLGLALSALTAASALASAATTAHAIGDINTAPATDRTEVGAYLALWDDADAGVPTRFASVCSGTMIDRDTYLTAAHCNADWPAGTRVFVSLDQDVRAHFVATADMSPARQAEYFVEKGWAVEGDMVSMPGYPGPMSDYRDLGLVEFSHRAVTPADRWSFTPAQLPTEGQLDALGPTALKAASWLVVGYGTQPPPVGTGGMARIGGGVRMAAPVAFDALNPTWVRLGMNASRDLGQACYGDSGGPNFVTVGGRRLVAGVTTTGDATCRATNVAYRTDTPQARRFLAGFVSLPTG